jgi:hypothetical protein
MRRPGRLTRFLSELGTGFEFVGRQYKITWAAATTSSIVPIPGLS